MHVNDTFGRRWPRASARFMPKFPQTAVQDRRHHLLRPGGEDLSVEVSKAKASNADFLLLVSRLNDAILLRREMVKQRWNPMGISARARRAVRGAVLQDARQALRVLDLQRALVQPEHQAHQDRREGVPQAEPKDINGVPRAERRLHVRGAARRGRRLQARKTTDPKTLADAIRADQYHRQDDARRPDQVQRQGPGGRHRLGAACRTATSRPPSCCPRAPPTAKPVFPVPGYKKA